MQEELKNVEDTKDTLLEKQLKKELPETWKEETEMTFEKWQSNLGDNLEYANMLKEENYSFTDQGFGKKEDLYDRIDLVSNFFAIPVRKINTDTGEEISSVVEIKGVLNTTEELPSIMVPINKLEGTKWYNDSKWGLKIRFYPGAKRDLLVDSIKFLSKDIEEQTIYKFTGFTKIKGKDVFLHSNGGIGSIEDVKVDLEDENLARFTFTDEEFDIKDTFKLSLSCLEIAPKHITVPTYSLTFLAPLTSLIEELGIPVGFLTWVLGPQQCKKTSLVTAIGSHFGFFDKNHAPLSFLDGVPGISKKCGVLKDVMAVCDDYFPSANKQEAAEMQKKAEKLISLCADKMTGARSKSNGELRKTYRAKGQIIATGELFPDLSQSRTSRVLFVEVNPRDIDGKKLGIIQKHQKELQYTMKIFIEYIISNMEDIKAKIPVIYYDKVEAASNTITYRTAEMLSALYVGFAMLMEFAVASEVLTEEEKQAKLKECWDTLLEVGKSQNMIVEDVSPIKMLLSAVEILTNTEKLSTVEMETAKYMKSQEMNKDGFIGFYDKETNVNFVYPDLLYKAVKKFYNEQGMEFPLTKTTMCRELRIKEYLYTTPKQDRPQVRRLNPRTKREETFIGILQDKLNIPYRYNDTGTIMKQ